MVPDQYAQAVWITRGVDLAQLAQLAPNEGGGAYLALERAIFPLTAGWGALGYTLAALGWTASFARAGTWSRALTILSITTWSTMLVAVTSPIVPEHLRPSAKLGSTRSGFWPGRICSLSRAHASLTGPA